MGLLNINIVAIAWCNVAIAWCERDKILFMHFTNRDWD